MQFFVKRVLQRFLGQSFFGVVQVSLPSFCSILHLSLFSIRNSPNRPYEPISIYNLW